MKIWQIRYLYIVTKFTHLRNVQKKKYRMEKGRIMNQDNESGE